MTRLVIDCNCIGKFAPCRYCYYLLRKLFRDKSFEL